MSNAWKGALWSAFVFPGVGQIVLKHYRRGIVLLLVCSAGLLAFVTEAMRQATAIVDKMLSEGGNIDEKAIEKASGSESLPLHLLGWLMIGCWIFGIVDAYRIGRKKDIEARLTSQGSSGSTLYS